MRGMGQYSGTVVMLFIVLGLPERSRAVDFAPATAYPVGTSPSAIVVGDFNGDGKSDLAVANVGSTNVSVLINQGNPPTGPNGAIFLLPGNNDGTFQAPVQIQADRYPASVAVADLNGDGKSDLILGDAVNGTLTILMGKGDGTFQKPSTVTLTSAVVAALAVGDFNADKNVDIVAAVLSGPVFILSGKGDGSFQAPVQITTAATSPHLLVGNFDADSKLDLVVRSETPRPSPCRRPPCIGFDRFQVLGGNGDGTFNPPTLVSIFNASVGNLAAGDFNADSKLDLILSRSGSGLPYLGRNNDTFLAHPALWIGLGSFVAAAERRQFIRPGRYRSRQQQRCRLSEHQPNLGG